MTSAANEASVRKPPSWPRSWTNVSSFYLELSNGNACPNLHVLGQPNTFLDIVPARHERQLRRLGYSRDSDPEDVFGMGAGSSGRLGAELW